MREERREKRKINRVPTTYYYVNHIMIPSDDFPIWVILFPCYEWGHRSLFFPIPFSLLLV